MIRHQADLKAVIPLIPPSVNGMYGKTKSGRRFLIPRAKDFKEGAIVIVRNAAQLTEWRYVPGQRLRVVCTYFFKENRTIDLDNLLKLTLDALKEALHFDDNRAVVAEVTARDGGIDRHNARCEVEIEVLS